MPTAASSWPLTTTTTTTTAMDIDRLPPITLGWALAALTAALLEHISFLTFFSLFYTPALVFRAHQYWRLVTTFIYFGPLGLDFIFHLFFFTRYSRMLEETAYAGPAEYVWLLLTTSTALLLVSPAVGMPFLASPLAFVLVYIWSRRNRHVRLSLFGVLVVSAPYLPWSLAAIGWMLNGRIDAVMADIVGIAIGHLCTST